MYCFNAHTHVTRFHGLTITTSADRVSGYFVQCRNSGHEIFHDNAVRGPVTRTTLVNSTNMTRNSRLLFSELDRI